MKRLRFTKNQIVRILKEVKESVPVLQSRIQPEQFLQMEAQVRRDGSLRPDEALGGLTPYRHATEVSA